MPKRLILVPAPAPALCLALALCLAAAAPALAAPRPARDQLMPTAAHNPLTESTMLLWVEDRGGGPDIYAKRMFNNGLPKGGPDRGGWQVVRDDSAFNRNSEPPGPREDPRLVYNSQREEFLLVFPETGLAEAADVAEAIRRRVEEMRFPVADGRTIDVRVSIGLASLGPDGESPDTVDELLAAADAALYRAKAAGRNRVEPLVASLA